MIRDAVPALLTLLLVLAVSACGQPKEEQTVEKEPQIAEGPAQTEVAAKPTVPDPGVLVWVYRASGRKQCEGGGMTMQQSLARLQENGVTVQASRCGMRTDRMYPSMCGAPTGDILLHQVSMDALEATLELGYNPAEQVQYQTVECRDNSA
ncbi:hypothetical protein [Microbulbifer sp. 2205BS26-8]|uniref:hypothetical protein n=1 Tax=Microbulbifer sp. 2205BS26-8 TaxID=3064386 RepID=UPI00273F6650|nr:hypothetical protein [Microbulbifer sp. 2205BS26-8]MDP5210641.1 hypothetical protein [Microbulbifer sp. 2205BS26-8]